MTGPGIFKFFIIINSDQIHKHDSAHTRRQRCCSIRGTRPSFASVRLAAATRVGRMAAAAAVVERGERDERREDRGQHDERHDRF